MKASKSAIFLFELMIVILVFTFAAAICSQIFASAHNMSTESHDLTMSSINAQSVAEYYKAGNPNTGPVYFDSEWNATGEADATYRIELSEQDAGPQMREAYVNVYKKDIEDSIFSLHVKEFVG